MLLQLDMRRCSVLTEFNHSAIGVMDLWTYSFPHILRVWPASPATCYQAYRVRIRLRYDVEASRRRYRNVPWLPSLPASALRFPHRRILPVTCRHHYGRVHTTVYGNQVVQECEAADGTNVFDTGDTNPP